MIPVRVRWMVSKDLDQVLDLEETGYDAPWSRQNFKEVLMVRNTVGLVAECDKSLILGFAIYQVSKKSMHVLSLTARPVRRGIGRQLMFHLFGMLNKARNKIVVNLGDDNVEGHLFLRAMGFEGALHKSADSVYRFEYSATNNSVTA